MPVAALAADPLRTLGAGLARTGAAFDDAAQRVAADPLDVDALVDIRVTGLAYAAVASAFGSVAETQRHVLDMLA